MIDAMCKLGHVLGGYWEAWHAIARQNDSRAIRDVQTAKLRRLVRHSFEHVKYYREAFEREGILPEHIRSVDDLSRLPLLTKTELRNQFWDFLPHSLPACRVTRTSGSTGVPVCIFSDWVSRRRNWGAVIRFHRAAGIPFIGRAILTLLRTEEERRKPAHWTVAQGLHKRYYLNPYIDAPDNRDYARLLAKRLNRPVLKGIPTALKAFAEAVNGGVFPAFRPHVILSGGEMLTASVREFIQVTFSARVVDAYACNETRDVAWQCRYAGGYHVNADNVIVEILKEGRPARPGEVGEVTLTDLNRYVMPIIRYQNGDLARRADEFCPCGSRLPLIAEIIGRTGENVILPDGTVVLWNHLKSKMTHPHIRQFQLVQRPEGDLVARIVLEKECDAPALDHLLCQRLRAVTGSGIPIRIEHVDAIPITASGKTMLVASEYQAPSSSGP